MKINLMCPVNVTGYGYASTNILHELAKLIDVSLFPIGTDISAELKHHNTITQAINKAQLFNVWSPTLRIFHQFSMAESIGFGERLGLPIFELNKFNNIEKHHLKSLNKIFSCSKWASDIIKDQIGVDSPVVPLGVDSDIFKPAIIPKSSKTVFFNAGKWEKRKHDVILETFCKAFRKDDNVELWMACDNICKPDENIRWQTIYKSSLLSDKIKFISRRSSQLDLYEVMKYAHYGFFPSHAEGWNMELLEMLSCGRKCIATNYSAHTEYCNTKNSNLVDITDLEPAHDNIWFHGQGEWATIGQSQKEQIVNYLRNMYEEHQSDKDIFNYEGVTTSKIYTWENTANTIVNLLKA